MSVGSVATGTAGFSDPVGTVKTTAAPFSLVS